MSHRITDWDPEDVVAWEAGNKLDARNLIWSVAKTSASRSGDLGDVRAAAGDMSKQWPGNRLET